MYCKLLHNFAQAAKSKSLCDVPISVTINWWEFRWNYTKILLKWNYDGKAFSECDQLHWFHLNGNMILDDLYQSWMRITYPIFSGSVIFPVFTEYFKYLLPVEYNVHFLRVSPQLGGVGTCQIWMWYKESNRCFYMKNLHSGQINALVTLAPGLPNPFRRLTHVPSSL